MIELFDFSYVEKQSRVEVIVLIHIHNGEIHRFLFVWDPVLKSEQFTLLSL